MCDIQGYNFQHTHTTTAGLTGVNIYHELNGHFCDWDKVNYLKQNDFKCLNA